MVIFFNFKTTSNYLQPLQVENCDSNSRLVVDEDDNGKPRLERGKTTIVVISSERVNTCPAELLQLYFSSFEAGIANAISSFK